MVVTAIRWCNASLFRLNSKSTPCLSSALSESLCKTEVFHSEVVTCRFCISAVSNAPGSLLHLFYFFHNVCFMFDYLQCLGISRCYDQWPMHFCKALSWNLWIKASAKWINLMVELLMNPCCSHRPRRSRRPWTRRSLRRRLSCVAGRENSWLRGHGCHIWVTVTSSHFLGHSAKYKHC